MFRIIIQTTIVSIVLLSVNNWVSAQSKNTIPENKTTDFSNPEPPSNAPINISVAESDALAQNNIGWCGFTEVYFPKDQINGLLGLSGCVGVRVYNGKEDQSQYFADVIMVAIDANGNELGKDPNYLLGRALDVSGNFTVNNVTKSHAKGCISNLDRSRSFVLYTAYFSKNTLSNLLNQASCTGLKIKPADVLLTVNGKEETYRTMSAGAAWLNNNKLSEVGSDYLKSAEPCPTICGTSGGKYLWEK